MIQNNQATMQNVLVRRPQQAEDFIRLQDLMYLCLVRWRWFVISLVVTLGIATYNLLSTPCVYQRTASILIKEDGKSQSINSDVASMFSDMGISGGKSNVNNELIAIQSPAVLLEAGKQLKLDVNYSEDGTFHPVALYGRTLPVTVHFYSLNDMQSANLDVEVKHGNLFSIVHVSGTDKAGNQVESDEEVQGKLGQTVRTAMGYVCVDQAPGYSAFVNGHESRKLHVTRTNLYAMTDHIKASLSASISEEKATVIDLTYKDQLTQRAEDVLNTIISVYRKNWMEDKNQMTVSTSHFITERLGVIERELGDVDKDISSFKSRNLLPDVETAAQQYMQKSGDVDKQILELNSRLSMARYLRDFLTGKVGKNQLLPANIGIDSPGIEQQITEYNKQQLERNNLVANSSEQNPLVADYDQSLASMRHSIVTSIDNFVVTLNSQLGNLQANEAQTTSQIASNPSQAKYLQTVGRQQKVKEALYLFLLQKREENELSKAFTAYNTRIITPPTGDTKPVQPVRRNIILVAFVLGVLIPVVVIFIRENMNTTVRGRNDLKNITIPFLGEIPYSISRKNRPTLLQRIQFWKKPKETLQIVVKAGKRDIVNEAFRVLRTNLEFMIGTHPEQNVIILTSFNPGSGKSHLAGNIAMSLAIKKKKVLVIDGDLRRGTTSMLVGSPGEGLSDYLNGRTDDLEGIICHGEEYGLVKDFDVLPIGTMPPNPTELLFTDRLEKMIRQMRGEYDYVFIDCPPVEIVADTQIIEKLADRTIFVVRSGLMQRSMLGDIEQFYKDKKFKNMSLILNGTKAQGGRYGHYYRYGYHYGYGYGYHYGSDKNGGAKIGK